MLGQLGWKWDGNIKGNGLVDFQTDMTTEVIHVGYIRGYLKKEGIFWAFFVIPFFIFEGFFFFFPN
jgi:hypothetical protein